MAEERIARLGISVNSKQVKEAKNDLRNLQTQAKDTERATDKLGKTSSGALDKTTRSASKTENSFRKMALAVGVGAGAVVALDRAVQGAVRSMFRVLGAADSMRALENRIRLVTDSAEEFAKVQDGLFNISARTYQAVESTTQAYQRMAAASDKLGISHERLLGITETVNKTVAMSGSTSAASEAALVQFGQALSNNFQAAAQEINSLNEQVPALSAAIARGLSEIEGVEFGRVDLKKLAEAGELSAEKVLRALEVVRPEIDRMFGDLNVTFAQIATTFQTNGKRLAEALFGPLLEANVGLFRSLSRAIGSEEILAAAASIGDKLVPAVEGLGAATASLIAMNFTAWLLSANGAVALISKSVMGLFALVAAHPFGALAIALSAAIGFMAAYRDEIARAISPAQDFVTLMRATAKVLGEDFANAREAFSSFVNDTKLLGQSIADIGQWLKEILVTLGAIARLDLGNITSGLGKGGVFEWAQVAAHKLRERSGFFENDEQAKIESDKGISAFFEDRRRRINEEIRKEQNALSVDNVQTYSFGLRGKPEDLLVNVTPQQDAAVKEIRNLENLATKYDESARAARVFANALEISGGKSHEAALKYMGLAEVLTQTQDRLSTAKANAGLREQIRQMEILADAYGRSLRAGQEQAKAFETFGELGDTDAARRSAKEFLDAENAAASAELSAALSAQRVEVEKLINAYSSGERAVRVFEQAQAYASETGGVVTESLLRQADAAVRLQERINAASGLARSEQDLADIEKLNAALRDSVDHYEVIATQIGLIASGWDETQASSLATARNIVEHQRQSEILQRQFERIKSLDVEPFQEFGENAADYAANFFDRFREEGFSAFDDLGRGFKDIFQRLARDIFAEVALKPLLEPIIKSIGSIGLSKGEGGEDARRSIFDSLEDGFDKMGDKFQGLIESLSDGLSKISSELGDGLKSLAPKLGTALAGAAAGFSGFQLGSGAADLFNGDQGETGGAIGGAVGGGLGFAFGGPAGAFIGSALGGFLGDVFGGLFGRRTASGQISLATGGVVGGADSKKDERNEIRDQILQSASDGISALVDILGGRLDAALNLGVNVGKSETWVQLLDRNNNVVEHGENVSNDDVAGAINNALKLVFEKAFSGGDSFLTGVAEKFFDLDIPAEKLLGSLNDISASLSFAEEPTSQFREALESLIGAFDSAASASGDYAQAMADLADTQYEAINKLAKQYDRSLADERRALEDPVAQEVVELLRRQVARLDDVEALNAAQLAAAEKAVNAATGGAAGTSTASANDNDIYQRQVTAQEEAQRRLGEVAALNTAEFVSLIESMGDTPEKLAQIQKAFSEFAGEIADTVSSQSQLSDALSIAASAMADALDRQVQADTTAILSPEYARFEELLSKQKKLLDLAQQTGANINAVQLRNALEVNEFFNRLTEEQKLSLGDYLGEIENVTGRVAVVMAQLAEQMDRYIGRLDEQRDATLGAAQAAKGHADSLEETAYDIKRRFGRGNPEDRLSEQQQEFFRLANAARAGDDTAYERVNSIGVDIVEQARSLYAGTQQFASVRDSVLSVLENLRRGASENAAALFNEADRIAEEIDTLKEIRTILADRENVGLLKGILDTGRLQNDLTRSLVQELISLRESQRQADQLTIAQLQAAAFKKSDSGSNVVPISRDDAFADLQKAVAKSNVDLGRSVNVLVTNVDDMKKAINTLAKEVNRERTSRESAA